MCRLYPPYDHLHMYRVERFVLLSEKNSSTNFHIDFSGACVGYVLTKGEKVIYVVKRTENNIKLFYEWEKLENKYGTLFLSSFNFNLTELSTDFPVVASCAKSEI